MTLIILLEVLMIPVNAVTEAWSFANSNLISQTSNFTLVNTAMQTGISTTDINFGSHGELNTKYMVDREGVYQINQGIWTWLNNTNWYNGRTNWNTSLSGAHIIYAEAAFNGSMALEFSPYRYNPGATSETSAFATSDGHIGNYSAIAKTTLDSVISSPVIIDTPNPTYNFRTQGEVSTEFNQTCNGTYQLNQGITTSPDNYFGLHDTSGFYTTFYKELENKSGFSNTQHNTFTGSKVTSAETFSYGNITVGFPNLTNPDQSKAQTLQTNVTSKWNLDVPADLFKQDINLEFRTADDQMAYSGFDITREVAIGDIDCTSEMELVYHNT